MRQLQRNLEEQGEQQDLVVMDAGAQLSSRQGHHYVEVVFSTLDPSVYIPLHVYTPISPTLNYRTSNGTIVIILMYIDVISVERRGGADGRVP